MLEDGSETEPIASISGSPQYLLGRIDAIIEAMAGDEMDNSNSTMITDMSGNITITKEQ